MKAGRLLHHHANINPQLSHIELVLSQEVRLLVVAIPRPTALTATKAGHRSGMMGRAAVKGESKETAKIYSAFEAVEDK